MTATLRAFVREELDRPVAAAVADTARQLASRLGAIAVLFYGSNLRTGSLEGVLDFYVLVAKPSGSFARQMGTRMLWPDVSFHEVETGGQVVRAKVATMPIDTFEHATAGRGVDTTVWTRFVQPSALVWRADPSTASRVVRAVANAAITACGFAAALGPSHGRAAEYWQALFNETYEAELRVEPPGRAGHITAFEPQRYERLLALAWDAGGIRFERDGDRLVCHLRADDCIRLAAGWLARARFGKALNLLRLVKAAFTFDGAARYGAWKIERHTGIRITLTPWRERHPILAAPGVVWQVLLWNVMRPRAA